MKIVRDLQADVYRMRRTFVFARAYAHHSAACPLGNPRHQAILAGKSNASFGFAEANQRTRVRARDKATPMDRHLTARNGAPWADPLNVRSAGLFWRRAEPEF